MTDGAPEETADAMLPRLVLVTRGNGWAHAWLTRRLDADAVAKVAVALAEVGNAPDVVLGPDAAPGPNGVLMYHRDLSADDEAMIAKAAGLVLGYSDGISETRDAET